MGTTGGASAFINEKVNLQLKKTFDVMVWVEFGIPHFSRPALRPKRFRERMGASAATPNFTEPSFVIHLPNIMGSNLTFYTSIPL